MSIQGSCTLVSIFAFAVTALGGEESTVKVTESNGKWSLNRGSKDYQIKGAAGEGSLKLLAESGANSVRTWGFDQLEGGLLDRAHARGLSVCAGIWLRHDLDYQDENQVAEQTRLVMEGVRKYMSHPAILIWGIGNEMEGDGENLAVWRHIESLASLIKKEDPHHPTMTVIAEIGGNKVKNINRYCSNIDIIGINAYGGAASIPKRYREAGGTKPYILAEFGPRGPWDLEKNAIGSVNEELGKVKAATYLESYQAFTGDKELCLGSYAFMWGHKQEATPTWFGMFLADGRKTAAVDVMTQLWSGEAPNNRCPQIDLLTLVDSEKIKVNSLVKAKVEASDPEDERLKLEWVLMSDAKKHLTAGYHQETPPTFNDHILETFDHKVTFRAPKKPGLYRIFCYVGDSAGGADVANVVFRVDK